MIAVVLDHVQIKRQIVADLALDSNRPLLNIPQFQAAGIDGNHAVFSEIGILPDIDGLPRIAVVPVERRKHLIVEDISRVESVWNATPGIQVQRNIKHAERRAYGCLWRELVRPTQGSRKVMVVVLRFERVAPVLRKFQGAGLPGNRIDRCRIEIRPVAIFFVIASVEVPSKVHIQSEFRRDLDVVLSIERHGFSPPVGAVRLADRRLIHIAQQKACKSEAGASTKAARGLRGIKHEGRDSIVSMRVHLLNAKLGPKFVGGPALYPRQGNIIDEGIRSVEIVVLAPKIGFIDGHITNVSVTRAIYALKLAQREIPRTENRNSQRRRPAPSMRLGLAWNTEAVISDAEDVKQRVRNRPGIADAE